MESGNSRLFAGLVVAGSVAGSLFAFTFTGSQAQFGALNGAVLAFTAGVAIWPATFGGPLLGRDMRAQRPAALLLLAPVIWAVIATAFSGRAITALFGEATSNLGLLSMMALGVLGWYAASHPSPVRRALRWAAPLLIIVQGGWALLQPVGLDAGHGGYGNSSTLGLALAILLPWTLDNGPDGIETASWERFARRLVAAFAVLVCLVIEARAAAGLMTVLLVWRLARPMLGSRRVARRVAAVGSLMGAIAVLGIAVLEYAGRSPVEFFSIRYELWLTALRALAQRPISGYGPDGFFSAGARHVSLTPVRMDSPLIFGDGTTDPHNLLIWLAVSFGLVGLGLFVALLFLAARAGARSEQAPGPGLASSVIGFLLLLTMPASLDVLPLWALSVGCWAGALLGRETPGSAPQRKLTASTRHAIRAPRASVEPSALVITAVLGAALVLLAVDSTARVSLGPASYFRPLPLRTTASMASWFGWDPYFTHELNASFGDAQLTGIGAISQTQRWSQLTPRRAVSLDRHNPYFALSYARAAWNAGVSRERIEAAYAEALRRYPTFPLAHADLALVSAQAGDSAAARAHLDRLKPFGDPTGYPWESTVRRTEELIAAP